MGKSKKPNKRKRNSGGSDDRPAKVNNGGLSLSVSDTLHSVNNILFEDVTLNDSVFLAESDNSIQHLNMADNQVHDDNTSSPTPPSSTDILNYLKGMDKRIMAIDKRLSTLDSLEKKVTNFESDLKKLWSLVYDNNNNIQEKATKLTDEVESLQFSLNQAQCEISKLQSDKVNIEDNLLYVQSQSMRNNLIFSNIQESEHEKPEDCERIVRQFMVDKLKLAQDTVDSIGLERVHRTGNKTSGVHNKPRNIVAKFTSFKDREIVRRSKGKLKGTEFFVFEQFPKEIADRRRSHLPKLKQALRDGKRAWLSYDTLYINGHPVRDGNQ